MTRLGAVPDPPERGLGDIVAEGLDVAPPPRAVVVTFTAGDTRFNVWVWPDSGTAEVNTAAKGTSAWGPHVGPVEVETQGC